MSFFMIQTYHYLREQVEVDIPISSRYKEDMGQAWLELKDTTGISRWRFICYFEASEQR